MSEWYTTPARVAPGETLGVDDIKVRRPEPHPAPTSGVFSRAWELVKAHPGETIVLGVLNVMFGGGGSGCFDPTPLIELFEQGGETSYESSGFLLPVAASAFGALELSLVLVVGAIVTAFVVLMVALQTGIAGGTAIYWLRLVRGQSASLNHTGKVIPVMLPLLGTVVLQWLGIFTGYLLLIVPGVMLTYGWFFVTHVVVDKNLKFRDALAASWRLTDGYKGQLFVVAILMGLLNIGGMLACCVGMFVTNAINSGVVAILYDRLATPGNAYLDESEDVLSAFD